MRILTLSLAIGWLVGGTAIASDAFKPPAVCTEVQTCGAAEQCGRCGRVCQCEKHCHIVCEMREIKKHVWIVHCEEFCPLLPGCGHSGCKDCDACECGVDENCVVEPGCCGGCGKGCDPCAAEKNKCFVPPKCGKMRTKKTLEKKEVVCKVPCYKRIVVYCCPSCCNNEGCEGQPVSPAPEKPQKPAPAPTKTIQKAPLPPVVSTSFVK
jgi:hypothetical protein